MRHGNIPQPSPTEKQNLDVVSHSALPSSSPGSPAVQSSPVLGALGRGLSRVVHQQPSRKKHAKRTLLSRGQTERKDATSPAFPERAASSLVCHPCGSWGPPPSAGPKLPSEPRGTAHKDDGSRHSSSPPDFAPPSLSPFLGASAQASVPCCSGLGWPRGGQGMFLGGS